MYEGPRRYYIPANFTNLGYFLGGRISKRSAADAALMAVVGFLISRLLPLSGDVQLSVTVFICGVFGLMGIVGIHGLPISTYLIAFFQWTRRRKPKFYNNHSRIYSVSAAEVILTEQQLGDHVANVWKKMQGKFSGKKKAYIEGETFEFLPDPELETLEFMGEQREGDT